LAKKDLWSSLFWILCGILIVAGALRLPLGDPQNPGPGFLPLFIGGLMVLLATALLWRTVRKSEDPKTNRAGKPGSLQKLIGTFLAILLYVPAFSRLGFIPATIPLMIFLFKYIGEMGWKISVAGGILVSLSLYFIFKVWLQVQFPIGLWGI
jgi:putative tricarboxylic transport membrane protein